MLITFEGPEGAGKTTAIAGVALRLRERGREVLTTREPGAGKFGSKIRQILLEGADVDARAELFLFLADRANHVKSLIRPALAEGKIVLCDRFTDSTLVYQAYARGLDAGFVRQANEFATEGLIPDATILFDLEPEVGLARLQTRDRLDAQPLEFHQRVRAGFLKEARTDTKRWTVVDAAREPADVLEEVVEIVMNLIGKAEGA